MSYHDAQRCGEWSVGDPRMSPEEKEIERLRTQLSAERAFHAATKEALSLQQEAAENDARRLMFVAEMMDAIGPHDFHEDAYLHFCQRGGDLEIENVGPVDYLAAVRIAIDSAIAEQQENAA